jgi:rubrerythrin
MHTMNRRQILAGLLAAGTTLAGCGQKGESRTQTPAPGAGPEAGGGTSQDPVLTALQAAHEAEHALQLSLLNYAEAAGSDHPDFALLFQAAARSCEARISALGNLIGERGGTVPEEPQVPAASTLSENLARAIDEAKDLAENLYPDFRQTAVEAKDTDAITLISYGVQVWPDAIAIFEDAADALNAGDSPSGPYYVCPTCGHLTTVLDFDECPYCYTTAREFETIE